MSISGNVVLSPRKRGKDGSKPVIERSQEGGSPSNQAAPNHWSLKKLNDIYRFSRQMSALHSLEALLLCIAKETTTILEASFCEIFLLQPDGAWTHEAAYPNQSYPENQASPQVTGLAQFIYQQIVQKEQPTILRRGSAFWITLEHLKPFNSRSSCLCLVPLAFANESQGLLMIGLTGKQKGFTQNDEKSQLAAFLAEQAAGAIYRIKMANRLLENQSETVLALSKTIEVKDDPTGNHSTRMTSLAERTAAALHCTEEEIQIIHRAGLLHDIGKIAIPDEILQRPGPLSDEEWTQVRRHPDIGAEIVLMVSNLAQVAEQVRCHHERYDGRGYPRGLSGERIPLGGRILAVTDAYTTMVDGRAYRLPIPHTEAIAEIKRCSGSHFDPKVVEAFLTLF